MTDQKSVSSHLKIAIEDYDYRIRTFVPCYEEMLDEVEKLAGVSLGDHPTVLDLGIGTGAFSERCLRLRPQSRLIGIDSDPEMVAIALDRLKAAAEIDLRCVSFLDAELPPVDLIGGVLSLHHVPEAEAKRGLYLRCRRALSRGGPFLMADCFPPRDPDLSAGGWASWRRHLEQTYAPEETSAYFEAWSWEDTHFSLEDELLWLDQAGFQTEVTWRKDLFAVICCT
jgi:tRNA (cmo5U34)-methyltransferase